MRQTEAHDDFVASQSTPFTEFFASEIEKLASELYTPSVFIIVESQIYKAKDYVILRCDDSLSSILVYEVAWFSKQTRVRKVEISITNGEEYFLCDCRLLESMQIPCRHIFSVLMHRQRTDIPKSCIFQRWTKQAKFGLFSNRHRNLLVGAVEDIRYRDLVRLGSHIFLQASKNKDMYNKTKQCLEELIGQLGMDKRNFLRDVLVVQSEVKNEAKYSVLDPQKVISKGTPKRRLKSCIEKRKYRCGQCHKIGHTIRTCPMVANVVP
jgi:hypothetical protein